MYKRNALLVIITSLVLAACGTTPAAAPTPAAPAPTEAVSTADSPVAPEGDLALTTSSWQWSGFSGATEQFKVESPASYQLTFQADGTLAIVADCNNAAVTYTDQDGALTITVGQVTTAACAPESRSDQFMKLLGAAASYFFADNTLFINLAADGGVLRFDPAGTTAPSPEEAAAAAAQMQAMLAGALANPWKWTTLATSAEDVTVETPTNYMVTFKADGSLEVRADCNNATGSYTLDGANITITLGATTLAACPGASRSEQFLQLLGDAAQLVPLQGKLLIAVKTEDNTMVFDPVLTTVAELCGDGALALNAVEDTLPPAISAQLDQGLLSFVQAAPRPGPGASMLIITPQGRYFKSIGVADVSTCAPLAANSPYQIGSNTKMMTSAIIFQLQEEGMLATSDLLSKWLPELAAQLPNSDKITLDMLLTHTSGIPDYFKVPTEGGASIESGTTDRAMLTRGFTPEELVTMVAKSGLSDFAPGAEGEWNYSNTGYILLGLIIEKATGTSYEENLKGRIFEPLGLQQTYLQGGLPAPGALPQAYYRMPFEFTTSEWNASQGWSAGAVVSTPEEFATFLKALFTGKLFKQPETLGLMQQHTSAGEDALGPGTVYAHGMLDNNGVLGHGGQTLGFQSDGGYILDQDVTIVLWSNAAESNVSRAIVPEIAKLVLDAGQ
jgi:D-alanyl-D-alanine carboxypeptidase